MDNQFPWPHTDPPTPTPTLSPTFSVATPKITVHTPTPRPTFSYWFTTSTPRPDSSQDSFDFASLQIPAVGVAAVLLGAVSAFYLKEQRRVNERKLRGMPNAKFVAWVIKRLGGRAASGEFGIDGVTMSGMPVMIKQEDNVDRRVIEKFAAGLARSRKRQGLVVAFSFGSDAIKGKLDAKNTYRLDIELVDVNELTYNKRTF